MADAMVPAADDGLRRSNDVEVAELRQWARGHEQRCTDRERAAKDYRQTIINTVTAVNERVVSLETAVEKRVGRLETGVVSTLVTLVLGGSAIIGMLVKIVLHLP